MNLNIGNRCGSLYRGSSLVGMNDVIVCDKRNPKQTKNICFVKNLVNTGTITRAGIVIYSINEEGKIIYCFANDWQTSEVTDFGGKFSKYDQLPIITAQRELNEESQGLFKIELNMLSHEPCIFDDENLIIFVYKNIEDVRRSKVEFKNRMSKGVEYPEVRDFVMVDFEDISKMMEYGAFYSRVNNVISGKMQFIENILLKKKYQNLISN